MFLGVLPVYASQRAARRRRQHTRAAPRSPAPAAQHPSGMLEGLLLLGGLPFPPVPRALPAQVAAMEASVKQHQPSRPMRLLLSLSGSTLWRSERRCWHAAVRAAGRRGQQRRCLTSCVRTSTPRSWSTRLMAVDTRICLLRSDCTTRAATSRRYGSFSFLATTCEPAPCAPTARPLACPVTHAACCQCTSRP